ncbi:MAG: exo-alpha-sialidase [Alcanivoracaceae bacterium]|nr:exo-alpha-sialidase [Alcanivoracaceae bacterium]
MKTLLLISILSLSYFTYASSNCNEASIQCGKTPTAIFDKNGKLWGVFYHEKYLYLSHSHNKGKSFSKPVKINAVAEEVYTNGENRPKIIIGPKQQIYISWTAITKGRFNGDIRFTKSTDGGTTFPSPVTINDDGLLTGHRFESLQISKSGVIYLIWIDKRDKVATKAKGQEYSGAAIYYATSYDNGKSFSTNKKVIDHTCECCRIATTQYKDNIVAMWRNIYATNTRDHALAVLTPAKLSVNEVSIHRATIDNWNIDACPHHGPDISFSNEQGVHMAWFSDGSINKGLSYAFFDLKKNRIIKQKNMDERPGASHPQVLFANDKTYYLWKYFDGVQTQLLLKTSNDFGKIWSETNSVFATPEANDHPFLLSGKNKVYFTWLAGTEYVVKEIL